MKHARAERDCGIPQEKTEASGAPRWGSAESRSCWEITPLGRAALYESSKNDEITRAATSATASTEATIKREATL